MEYKLLVPIIIIFIIIFLLAKKCQCIQPETTYYQDPDEVNVYKKSPVQSKDLHHLFWTGGFDSTFRLAQIIIERQEEVQPIYLMCCNLDSQNSFQRKNTAQEIKTMKRIRQYLHQNYPNSIHLLLPTMYVTGIKHNPEVERKYQILRQKHKLFVSRSICQYERMAQFASSYPSRIEVGLEKCGTGLDKATQGKRVGLGETCCLDPTIPNRSEFKILDRFLYPICHLTKEDMVQEAKQEGYLPILELTLSCWFPSRSGTPCGKCQMCKKRIL